MIDNLKTLVACILRHLLKILSFGNFHKNRIVFFSYFGKQYSCNPKYISEYIQNNTSDLDIIWAFNSPDKYLFLKDTGITLVKYNSISFIRACLTSRYIITNSEIPAWFPLTKKQTLINTWHGGGAYKKVGSAYQKETHGKQKRAQLARKTPCIYMSSSKAFTQMTLRESFHHTGKILAYGMPRNDILINRDHDELYKKIYTYFNIPAENHILLYAPTYRESKKAKEYLFDCQDVKTALSKRYGGNWTILFRMHYFIMDQLETSSEYIDASAYPDMQELLYVSDILITDYSSSMWDFALTRKPCFLYTTDLDFYDLSRGFYTDIHSWPYPLAENTKELSNLIASFNMKDYHKKIEQHLSDLGNLESGTASQQICKYLLSNM